MLGGVTARFGCHRGRATPSIKARLDFRQQTHQHAPGQSHESCFAQAGSEQGAEVGQPPNPADRGLVEPSWESGLTNPFLNVQSSCISLFLLRGFPRRHRCYEVFTSIPTQNTFGGCLFPWGSLQQWDLAAQTPKLRWRLGHTLVLAALAPSRASFREENVGVAQGRMENCNVRRTKSAGNFLFGEAGIKTVRRFLGSQEPLQTLSVGREELILSCYRHEPLQVKFVFLGTGKSNWNNGWNRHLQGKILFHLERLQHLEIFSNGNDFIFFSAGKHKSHPIAVSILLWPFPLHQEGSMEPHARAVESHPTTPSRGSPWAQLIETPILMWEMEGKTVGYVLDWGAIRPWRKANK